MAPDTRITVKLEESTWDMVLDALEYLADEEIDLGYAKDILIVRKVIEMQVFPRTA